MAEQIQKQRSQQRHEVVYDDVRLRREIDFLDHHAQISKDFDLILKQVDETQLEPVDNIE